LYKNEAGESGVYRVGEAPASQADAEKIISRAESGMSFGTTARWTEKGQTALCESGLALKLSRTELV
jgi:hypothetical protein